MNRWDKTVTVLTIDLPPKLSDQLRAAQKMLPELTVRDITLQALSEWLERQAPSGTPANE